MTSFENTCLNALNSYFNDMNQVSDQGLMFKCLYNNVSLNRFLHQFIRLLAEQPNNEISLLIRIKRCWDDTVLSWRQAMTSTHLAGVDVGGRRRHWL